MTYQHILYEVSDKIATVTLNRPDRMNAWTAIMERDVRHAMEAASADDNVRVIVLTGAGRAFCAGADMEALKGIDPNEIRRGESTPSFDMNRRADWQTRYAYYPAIPKPVIGMLNGATAGIGLVQRALLRPAFRGRQHRLHHRIRPPRADRRARHQLDAAAHRRACQRARSPDVGAAGEQRRSAAHRAGQPALSAGPVARADLYLRARPCRIRLAQRDIGDQAAALRRAVPDARQKPPSTPTAKCRSR